MGLSYSRPRGTAVSLGAMERKLVQRREQADVRLAAPSDQDCVTGRGPLRVPTEDASEVVGTDYVRAGGLRSGADGTRTRGLRSATPTLSQLSYSPERQDCSSRSSSIDPSLTPLRYLGVSKTHSAGVRTIGVCA